MDDDASASRAATAVADRVLRRDTCAIVAALSDPRLGRRRTLRERRVACAAAWASVMAVAIMSGCRGGDGNSSKAAATVRPPASTGEVAANADPRGVQNQPDWDQMAAELRERVDSRLPRPLAIERAEACDAMFAAVDRFYAETESDPGRRSTRARELTETRADDRAGCLERTSVEAAACVSVLMGDGAEHGALLSPLGRALSDYEYPWLLDQCMRAYPG